MKFRGYETFSLRKGWLHKGISEILADNRIFYHKDTTAMDNLGIGSNMVKALRYWLLATKLIEEIYVDGRRVMRLTDIGQVIWNNDPYFQEDGTWQIIHYLLSSNFDMATSWYFVFNKFNVSEFTKEDFEEALKSYIAGFENEFIPSDRSINDDFECILRTYYNRNDDIDPESNLICPLTELKLLTVSNEKVVHKTKPKMGSINPYIALAIIVNEACKMETNEVRIADIEKSSCNLGKTFNLDNISVSRILDILRNNNLVKVTRTAGLDVVKIKTKYNFIECVAKYYESIK